jgi:hypothetical protein
MSDRVTHATKARAFIKEMMELAKSFDVVAPGSRDQYRQFLLSNQAWKAADVHAEEAGDPEVTFLMRKATRIRVAINKKFFADTENKKG